MVRHHDEDDFDVSEYLDKDNIIDRTVCKRSDIRVRVKTMTIIENLTIANIDLPNSLLLRLPIRGNSVVSVLTGSSGKVSSRHKSEIDKSTIDKIKNLLSNCGSSS